MASESGFDVKKTVVAIALLVSLSACSEKSVAEPSWPAPSSNHVAPVASTTVKPAAQYPHYTDDDFIAVVRPADPYSPRADLIALGKQICVTSKQGVNAQAIGVKMFEIYTPSDAGTILGASVQTYCPERWAQVQKELGGK